MTRKLKPLSLSPCSQVWLDQLNSCHWAHTYRCKKMKVFWEDAGHAYVYIHQYFAWERNENVHGGCDFIRAGKPSIRAMSGCLYLYLTWRKEKERKSRKKERKIRSIACAIPISASKLDKKRQVNSQSHRGCHCHILAAQRGDMWEGPIPITRANYRFRS